MECTITCGYSTYLCAADQCTISYVTTKNVMNILFHFTQAAQWTKRLNSYSRLYHQNIYAITEIFWEMVKLEGESQNTS